MRYYGTNSDNRDIATMADIPAAGSGSTGGTTETLGALKVVQSGDTYNVLATDSVIFVASPDTAEITVILPSGSLVKHGQRITVFTTINSLYVATINGTPIVQNNKPTSTGITCTAITLTYINSNGVTLWLEQ